jgi:Zn-dependent protease/predicted transcriptional regulator
LSRPVFERTSVRHGRSYRLFEVAGIEVAVDPSWIVIFLLVLVSLAVGYFPARGPGYGWGTYAVLGVVATILFFASVLVHELAHAVVGNHFGEEVRRITLFIFGGMAHLSHEPRAPATEFKIAVVGPLTSFALAVLFWGIAVGVASFAPHSLWVELFGYLAFINAALGAFNLLPGFPLDGGRLLRAFFWWRSGDLRRATARAADWGTGIAIGLMVLGALEIFSGSLVGGLWLFFVAMFLRGAAEAGLQNVVVEQILQQTDVGDLMLSAPITVPPDTTVADVIDQYFLRYGYGGFPVATDGRAEGLVSLAQVRACPVEERARRSVREIMRPLGDDIRIAPDAPVLEALRRMMEAETGRLLVMRGSELSGILTRDAVIRFVHMKSEIEAPS